MTAPAGLELSPLVCFLPFVVAEEVAEASWISSRTRRSKAGKVRTWPDRRRVRACDWIAVGQSAPLELRVWRRRSWILEFVSLGGVVNAGDWEVGRERLERLGGGVEARLTL